MSDLESFLKMKVVDEKQLQKVLEICQKNGVVSVDDLKRRADELLDDQLKQ